MNKIYPEELEKRYPGIPAHTIAIKAFRSLLTLYYYHPVLWILYYVCKDLRACKPTNRTKPIRIHDYCIAKDIWFGGNMGGTQDILAIDTTTEASSYHAIVGVAKSEFFDVEEENDDAYSKTFYIIPREWLKRVFTRYEGKRFVMYLSPHDFCCRQILRRDGVNIVQCRSITIEEKYANDETFFSRWGRTLLARHPRCIHRSEFTCRVGTFK